jgi:DNA polymerase-4
VVLAASYEAKVHGVRTAMAGARARRLCPDAVVVSPRMSAYSEASKALFEVFDQTSALVEGLSIDEAFLDVGGLWRLSGSPTDIAERLRREVLDRVGLPISVGVARTKFLAKVASAVAKPDGLLVVPPDRERAFLHPLPIERLWGVGAVTSGKLRREGIRTVAQVAELGEKTLVRMLGVAVGRHLHAHAHNRDPRPVQIGRRRRSMGAQRSIGRKP